MCVFVCVCLCVWVCVCLCEREWLAAPTVLAVLRFWGGCFDWCIQAGGNLKIKPSTSQSTPCKHTHISHTHKYKCTHTHTHTHTCISILAYLSLFSHLKVKNKIRDWRLMCVKRMQNMKKIYNASMYDGERKPNSDCAKSYNLFNWPHICYNNTLIDTAWINK